MYWKKGIPIGTRKDYFINGLLSNTYKYLDGFNQWKYIVYYKNGKIKNVGIYSGNEGVKKNGIFKEYYENGTLKSEAVYKDDRIICPK